MSAKISPHRRPPRRRNSAAPLIALTLAALACVAGLMCVPRLPALDLTKIAAPALDAPASEDATVVPFTVAPGASAASIGEQLQRQKLIASADGFRVLVDSQGAGNKLKAGTYDLRSNMRPSEIIASLTKGEGPGKLVTIPEGRRLEEVAQILADAQVIPADSMLQALNSGAFDYSFLELKPEGNSLEGFLFPDSYRFGPHPTAQEVIKTMLDTFGRRAAPVFADNRSGLSSYDALTLAAIVEREAIKPEERPLIASVYLNRLQLGMKLDADPTVQYALANIPQNVSQFGWWKRSLLLDDLDVASPYNTYRRGGLPPGPIANPGLESIQAALRPSKSDYLYFVARADGSHLFARTFEDHLANARKVQQ